MRVGACVQKVVGLFVLSFLTDQIGLRSPPLLHCHILFPLPPSGGVGHGISWEDEPERRHWSMKKSDVRLGLERVYCKGCVKEVVLTNRIFKKYGHVEKERSTVPCPHKWQAICWQTDWSACNDTRDQGRRHLRHTKPINSEEKFATTIPCLSMRTPTTPLCLYTIQPRHGGSFLQRHVCTHVIMIWETQTSQSKHYIVARTGEK